MSVLLSRTIMITGLGLHLRQPPTVVYMFTVSFWDFFHPEVLLILRLRLSLPQMYTSSRNQDEIVYKTCLLVKLSPQCPHDSGLTTESSPQWPHDSGLTTVFTTVVSAHHNLCQARGTSVLKLSPKKTQNFSFKQYPSFLNRKFSWAIV